MIHLEINYLAVFFAALSSFLLGILWYSPILFKRIWMQECGLTQIDLKQRSPLLMFLVLFILSLVIALALAVFLGPDEKVGVSVGVGFAFSFLWVVSTLAMSYLREQKSLKLFLINSSYHVLQFTLIGLVLGLWP